MADHKSLHIQISRIADIMAALRDKQTGCPWDIEQSFETIAPYTIEEAYEVSEAIASGDRDKIADELGDLLLQVVFHAQIAEEEGSFTLSDVAMKISDKMIRRHPHVFGDETRADAAETRLAWEEMKAIERQNLAASKQQKGQPSILDDVAVTLPAMVRAGKLQRRAARVGFDWPDLASVIAKLHEETDELLQEWHVDAPQTDRLEDEIGDILFVASNLARKVGVDPESALLRTNRKFEKRFKFLEARLKEQGISLEDASLDEMEALWQQAKTTS